MQAPGRSVKINSFKIKETHFPTSLIRTKRPMLLILVSRLSHFTVYIFSEKFNGGYLQVLNAQCCNLPI